MTFKYDFLYIYLLIVCVFLSQCKIILNLKIILFVRVENKLQKKKTKMNGASKTIELSEKPDVSDLPLPELPDFFKKKHFLLYGDFSSSKQHELQRYITAYNG